MIQRANTQRPLIRLCAPSRSISPPIRGILVVALLFLLCQTSAALASDGTLLASIDRIDREGLRQAPFALAQSTEVQIRCVGLADSKGRIFLAQGWILNLETRQAVWTLKAASGSWDRESRNWIAQEDITLPAGIYAAYFAAYGGSFPLDKRFHVFGLEIGRLQMDVGPTVQWDDEGTPDEWMIQVRAKDASIIPAPLPRVLPGPYPEASVRLIGLKNSTVKRLSIDLDRPVTMQVHFIGEYARQSREFADGAWLTDRTTWERVWTPDWEMTDPAGGAEKNRRFDGTISLPKGSYLLTAVTDGTHATGHWNEPPPWDPEAWGIVLDPQDPTMRAAVHVTLDAGLPEPEVAITEAGDNFFMRKTFSLTRTARVLVRAEGENSGQGYGDFGWIERVSDDEPVWHMREQDSFAAGGARKNRLVESVLELPEGDYALCYVTDDSHSYGNWNMEQPWEPEAWGISIALLNGNPPAGAPLLHTGPPQHPPTVISIAQVRDDQRLVKEFDVTERVEVLLIAEGEGTGGEMSDYGWLVQESTGAKIWRMKYSETDPAGGSRKNRIVRATLTLPPGTYELHYVSDDSHAFGDWNDLPPDQPELWGVTLIEKD